MCVHSLEEKTGGAGISPFRHFDHTFARFFRCAANPRFVTENRGLRAISQFVHMFKNPGFWRGKRGLRAKSRDSREAFAKLASCQILVRHVAQSCRRENVKNKPSLLTKPSGRRIMEQSGLADHLRRERLVRFYSCESPVETEAPAVAQGTPLRGAFTTRPRREPPPPEEAWGIKPKLVLQPQGRTCIRRLHRIPKASSGGGGSRLGRVVKAPRSGAPCAAPGIAG